MYHPYIPESWKWMNTKYLYFFSLTRMQTFYHGPGNLYIMPSSREVCYKPIRLGQLSPYRQRWRGLMRRSPRFLLREVWQVHKGKCGYLHVNMLASILHANICALTLHEYICFGITRICFFHVYMYICVCLCMYNFICMLYPSICGQVYVWIRILISHVTQEMWTIPDSFTMPIYGLGTF